MRIGTKTRSEHRLATPATRPATHPVTQDPSCDLVAGCNPALGLPVTRPVTWLQAAAQPWACPAPSQCQLERTTCLPICKALHPISSNRLRTGLVS